MATRLAAQGAFKKREILSLIPTRRDFSWMNDGRNAALTVLTVSPARWRVFLNASGFAAPVEQLCPDNILRVIICFAFQLLVRNRGGNDVLGEGRCRGLMHHGVGIFDARAIRAAMVPDNVHYRV